PGTPISLLTAAASHTSSLSLHDALPILKTFARPRLLVLALYIASAALVTVQQAILRHSNNVSIFRSASFNLFAGRDLYAAHPEQDRKSTRLNSSHVAISYAVFCLKKKHI